MFGYIKDNLMGATVSIVVTGLPCVLTGEVVNSGKEGIIALKTESKTIYIEAQLIAFVF
jgi:hypothetical protein